MDCIEIRWNSRDLKPISWNKLYSQGHWTARKKLKDTWRGFFTAKLNEYDKLYSEQFKVTLTANSRADIDNIGIMAKFFVDALNNMDWIPDDSPKYYKQFTIKADKENLPFNHFTITYTPIV